MVPQDRTLGPLLELGNLAIRQTRAEAVERALRTALALNSADAAVLLNPATRRGERLVLHAGSAAPALLSSLDGGSEVARSFVENLQPLLLADLSEDARWAAGDGCPGVEAGPAMFTPLRLRDPQPGYVAVYRRRGRARFTAADARAMVLLSAWLAVAIENLRLSSGVEKFSTTDGLTEVYNARFLRAALRRELRRAARYGQELSLILLDLDPLEGAATTDELRGSVLLRELAALLAHQVRSFDLIARYREDQFMLVLPQTGAPGALEVAERMRGAVEHHAFSMAPAGAITASLGVASFPREGADEKALVASVERALEGARRRGPNRVESLAA